MREPRPLLAVIDAKSPTWPPSNYEAVNEWARSNGINPGTVFRVEITREEGQLVARVSEYAADVTASCPFVHDHAGLGACHPAAVVREVPVSSLPPLPEGDTA